MTRWYPVILAVAIGALAAVAAALEPTPLVAFVGAGLATLAAGLLLRQPAGAAGEAAGEAVPEGPRPAAGGAMPAGFGRALIETLPTPLLLVARSGVVTYANEAAHATLPRIRAGEHFAHLIRAPDFVATVNATLSGGGGGSLRFQARMGSGDRFLEATTALLPPGAAFGPEAMAIVQIGDRTEAQRAEALRSDFIANASHELRTPLASIVGYIETLQHHARDDAAARERFLAIMAREAARMQRLVDDLMSLSRIEMTEHLRPSEEWPLNAIAAESAAALAPLAAQEGVTLAIELAAETAADTARASLVRGDRDQLAQVFANLIDNAVKYAGRGATVRVFAVPPGRARPGRCGVVVADDGLGIPREHLPRLIERFYRVSAASSRTKNGTGLGLAIVKHV